MWRSKDDHRLRVRQLFLPIPRNRASSLGPTLNVKDATGLSGLSLPDQATMFCSATRRTKTLEYIRRTEGDSTGRSGLPLPDRATINPRRHQSCPPARVKISASEQGQGQGSRGRYLLWPAEKQSRDHKSAPTTTSTIAVWSALGRLFSAPPTMFMTTQQRFSDPDILAPHQCAKTLTIQSRGVPASPPYAWCQKNPGHDLFDNHNWNRLGDRDWVDSRDLVPSQPLTSFLILTVDEFEEYHA
ncbi:hypothetical protein CONLIGDRAFT_673930 [Coniochaeta ligniaria NRRL 30616]|uniref:Uncharacterized protein n=1 Tax=Coniochaeta ligniaria NRRL 30616 TaxID=1408157 RepID=A0A1J7J9S8_9PEZI|nr:hypothetical protein CONLIGDRAFT_673930 [Coniochaeta ligniaria NRRL 30616]